MPVLFTFDPIVIRHFPSGPIQAVVGSLKSVLPMPGGGNMTGLSGYFIQSSRRGSDRLAGYAKF